MSEWGIITMIVKATQKLRIQTVACKLKLPVPVVERVIQEYIESLQQSALKGEDIEVRGLFSIKMYHAEDGTYIPRGSVSLALKDKLARSKK